MHLNHEHHENGKRASKPREQKAGFDRAAVKFEQAAANKLDRAAV